MNTNHFVTYNIHAYNNYSLQIKEEYEQLINSVRRKIGKLEYACQFNFDIGEYVVSADNYQNTEYPVIHIVAQPFTDEVKELIEDAIEQNMEYHYYDKVENDQCELTDDDRSEIDLSCLRQDKIAMDVLGPDKFLDITCHECYAI